MPPTYDYQTTRTYDYPEYNSWYSSEEKIDLPDRTEDELVDASLTKMAFWYMIVLIMMLFTWLIIFFCLRIIALRQKTRSPQERRPYVGSRARPSFMQPEPTIYVSPSNLPPPPKYEAMAPPSYEEVVGVHYPSFSVQPITQPITSAMSQNASSTSSSTSANVGSNVATNADTQAPQATVITVTADERRTSVTVATSS